MKTIMFDQIPLDVRTKMLGDETLQRLNCNTTKFDFSGYHVTVPGFVCIPVKLSKDEEKKAQQIAELKTLGYEKLDQKLLETYSLNFSGKTASGYGPMHKSAKEIYAIPVADLMKVHGIEL